MNRQSQSALRHGFALAMVLALVLSVLLGAPLARAQDGGDGTSASELKLENAELRWGLNRESSGIKNFMGHNFLTAGDATEVIKGEADRITATEWKNSEGEVQIEKTPGIKANWRDAAPDSKTSSEMQFVFTGGEGTVDPDQQTASVKWTGTASVIYYSGMSFFTISDPELKIEKGRAKLSATLGGVASSRDGGVWNPLPDEAGVTIAELSLKDLFKKESGFSVEPEYFGVVYSAGNQTGGDSFGSFPPDFVDFLQEVGIGDYFYSTGLSADPRKPPLPLTVSWDSDDRTDIDDGGSSKGILGQVFDDTVEDILRSAGTDVSDTAAAWMDEAWKPLQPGAANADHGAQGAWGETAVVDFTVDSELVVDEEFAYEYEEYYSAGTPMTAGTVGAVAANSSGGSAGGSTPAAASAAPTSVADPGTMPVAANLPLTDVVYSNTSASSDAGNTLPQWQWWVGGVLLALAAGLFYQAVLRKD